MQNPESVKIQNIEEYILLLKEKISSLEKDVIILKSEISSARDEMLYLFYTEPFILALASLKNNYNKLNLIICMAGLTFILLNVYDEALTRKKEVQKELKQHIKFKKKLEMQCICLEIEILKEKLFSETKSYTYNKKL